MGLFADLWNGIVLFMHDTLLFFGNLTGGSYGGGIILLTLLVRLVLFPLTWKQVQSAAAMRELQPKVKTLQERYKDNPEELQKRLLELWREHNVNPLSGCLPIFVQMPILFALFQVLRDFARFEGQLDPWFLLWDLSSSDHVSTFFLLPVLSGVTTYIQTRMAMTDPNQRALAVIMPVFIGFISSSFPAGLVLYWVTSNVFGIAQQFVIMRNRKGAEGGA